MVERKFSPTSSGGQGEEEEEVSSSTEADGAVAVAALTGREDRRLWTALARRGSSQSQFASRWLLCSTDTRPDCHDDGICVGQHRLRLYQGEVYLICKLETASRLSYVTLWNLNFSDPVKGCKMARVEGSPSPYTGSLRMSGMQLVERMFSPTSTGWTPSQATPGVGSWTLGTPRKIRQPQHSKASASSSTARLRPATTQRGFG